MSEQQKTINNFYVLIGQILKPVENIKKGLSLIEQENKFFNKQSSEYQSKAFGMEGMILLIKLLIVLLT